MHRRPPPRDSRSVAGQRVLEHLRQRERGPPVDAVLGQPSAGLLPAGRGCGGSAPTRALSMALPPHAGQHERRRSATDTTARVGTDPITPRRETRVRGCRTGRSARVQAAGCELVGVRRPDARPRLVRARPGIPACPAGDRPSVQPARMKRRVAVFVGAWVAAFILLPAPWVATALAAWAAVAGLAVAEVTGQFQHIPEGEPEN